MMSSENFVGYSNQRRCIYNNLLAPAFRRGFFFALFLLGLCQLGPEIQHMTSRTVCNQSDFIQPATLTEAPSYGIMAWAVHQHGTTF